MSLELSQEWRHLCKWPGCSTRTKPENWACDRHWTLLPVELRREIMESYWPDEIPNDKYVEVIRKVGRWIAEQC